MVLCMVLQRGVTANQISQCSSICQSRPDCSAIRPELYIFQMSDSHFRASAAYSRHMQTAINQVLKDIFIYHNTLILYEKIVLYHILAETGGKTDSCSGPFFIVLMIRQGATLSASHIEQKYGISPRNEIPFYPFSGCTRSNSATAHRKAETAQNHKNCRCRLRYLRCIDTYIRRIIFRWCNRNGIE